MFVNYQQVQIQGAMTCLKSVLLHNHNNSAFHTKSNIPCSWINQMDQLEIILYVWMGTNSVGVVEGTSFQVQKTFLVSTYTQTTRIFNVIPEIHKAMFCFFFLGQTSKISRIFQNLRCLLHVESHRVPWWGFNPTLFFLLLFHSILDR